LYHLVSMRLRRGAENRNERLLEARKIARLTCGWAGKNKSSRFRPHGRPKNPVNEKQAKIDPRQKSARRDDVAMINYAPIRIDDDLRKTLRQRLRANLMCGN
jgi:hypothetical protein